MCSQPQKRNFQPASRKALSTASVQHNLLWNKQKDVKKVAQNAFLYTPFGIKLIVSWLIGLKKT